MKKAWLIAAAVLIVAATPFRVKSIIENALANERNAAARYEAFAAKAVEENNPGAASFFRAAARAEHVHAERFAGALRQRGIAIPEAEITKPAVGSTVDNLRAAASAEAGERDGIYREARDVAIEAGDDALAQMFDQARDTEVEHANILGMLLRNESLRDHAKTYFVCDECGYTSDVKLSLCALCRATKAPRAIE